MENPHWCWGSWWQGGDQEKEISPFSFNLFFVPFFIMFSNYRIKIENVLIFLSKNSTRAYFMVFGTWPSKCTSSAYFSSRVWDGTAKIKRFGKLLQFALKKKKYPMCYYILEHSRTSAPTRTLWSIITYLLNPLALLSIPLQSIIVPLIEFRSPRTIV